MPSTLSKKVMKKAIHFLFILMYQSDVENNVHKALGISLMFGVFLFSTLFLFNF